MSRADTPRLHVVTDDRILGVGAENGLPGSGGSGRSALRDGGRRGSSASFVETAGAVLEAGGDDLALHLRGPGCPGALLHELARELLPISRAVGARLVINDRVDVALAVGADGVHLGRRSLSPATARRLLGPGIGVGVSVHSPEEALEARKEGADYLFVGTIYASSSHPDRPAAGTGLLKEVSEKIDGSRALLPVIAIGGMEPDRVPEVTDAGAHGVASISAVWDARDPAGAVADFIEAFARPDE